MAEVNEALTSRTTCVQQSVGRGIFQIDFLSVQRFRNGDFGRTFHVKNYEGIKWRLLYEYSSGHGFRNILFSLGLVSCDQFNFNCTLILWLLNDDFEKEEYVKSVRIFQDIFEKLEIALDSPSNYVRKHNKINICFEIKLMFDEKECATCLKKSARPPQVSLANDLCRLLEEESGDVSLCVGDKNVKLHKTIVMARCPVLAAILDEEGDQNPFQDLDWDVVQNIVRYMYTDHVDDLENNAKKLYPAACKFKMTGLKELCEEEMEKSLTVETSAEILILADSLSRDWKARVIEYMKTNFEEIKATVGFKSLVLTHTHLYLELSCALLGVDAPTGAHKAA